MFIRPPPRPTLFPYTTLFRSAPQRVGALGKFSIERDHAAIRVLEFAIHGEKLLLPLAQFAKGADELAVLVLYLVQGGRRGADRKRPSELRDRSRIDEAAASWKHFLHHHGCTARPRIHGAVIHQAASPIQAEPHPRRGAVTTLQYFGEVADARSAVFHGNRQKLWRALALHPEVDFAAPGIPVRVARYLGHGGGNPRLILQIETEQARYLASTLARRYDVLLEPDCDCDKRKGHRSTDWEAREPLRRRGRDCGRGTEPRR